MKGTRRPLKHNINRWNKLKKKAKQTNFHIHSQQNLASYPPPTIPETRGAYNRKTKMKVKQRGR
jgi:hypothetical protein